MRQSSEENQSPEVDSESPVFSDWSRTLDTIVEYNDTIINKKMGNAEISPADIDLVIKHWSLEATA